MTGSITGSGSDAGPPGRHDIGGMSVLVLSADGPSLAAEGDADDILCEAWAQDVAMVAIPVARLAPGFLSLGTRLAGAVVQKFVTYHLRLAVVGDISARTRDSGALRDFVTEANRGRDVWFVRDIDELSQRLSPARAG